MSRERINAQEAAQASTQTTPPGLLRRNGATATAIGAGKEQHMYTEENTLMSDAERFAARGFPDRTIAAVRVFHSEAVLAVLKGATVSPGPGEQGLILIAQQDVLFHGSDGEEDEIRTGDVIVASAGDEFEALVLTSRVVNEDGIGDLALQPGSPLMAFVDEDTDTFVATFSLHDLRNGLSLDDLTLEYREYAEAFAGESVADTREWRQAFESGVPAEEAAERLMAFLMRDEDEERYGCGITMEELLEYQIEQAAGFGVSYVDGEWRV